MTAGVDNARLKSGFGNERATPHKLALCVLVRLYVSPDRDSNVECPLTPEQVRGLQLFLVQSIKRVDSIVEPVLLDTCREIQRAIGGGHVVSDFLRQTLEGIDSPDALFDLLESLRDILLPSSATTSAVDVDSSGRPTHIEASCVFGVLLRRVLLSCKRSFEALSRLFHEISLYRRARSSGAVLPGVLSPRTRPHNLKRKIGGPEDDGGAGLFAQAGEGECEEEQEEGGEGFESDSDERMDEEDEVLLENASPSKSARLGGVHPGKPGHHQQHQNKQRGNGTFRSFVSRRQLQYQLNCMVEEIESKIGIMSPQEVESQVAKMLAVSPDLPRAHFVRYMNCLTHREYQGAVDSLHTYFDYCMRSGGPTSSAAIATASAAAVAASGGRGTHGSAAVHASATLGRRRPMMQYAVLNLAALHYQFGHRREAMLAIQETVRVAQQNGDHVCVVFALSWLYRLALSGTGQETSQLLRRCLSRARELGLHHVQGLSHLVTAQYRLMAPTSIPTAMPPPVQGFNAFARQRAAPARAVWQSLERGIEASMSSIGTYVEAVTSALGAADASGSRYNPHGRNQAANQQDELYATGMPDQASRAAMSQAIKVVNASLATPSSHHASAMTIAGRAQLLESVAWESNGHASLSWLSAVTHLSYYSWQPGTASNDTCLAICRLACAQASLGTLGALCPTSYTVAAENRNAYVGALLLLLQALKTYRYRANNMIVQTLVHLLQARAIARGDVLESLMLGSTLRSLTPSQQSVSGIGGSFFSEGLHLATQQQWIEALRAMGRLSEAQRITHTLASKCAGLSLHGVQETMDLALARILLSSGSSAVSALPYTLRCISRTEKSGQETLYHAAAIKLAATQLRMGHVHQAHVLLQKALPHTAAHGSLEMAGELQLLLAKCHLAFANDGPGSAEHLARAAEALQRAYASYSEACQLALTQEVLYLTARVHDRLARMVEDKDPKGAARLRASRDEAAKLFILKRQRQARPAVRVIGYMDSEERLHAVACS